MHEDNNSNSIGDAKDVAVRLYLHDSLSMEEIGKHLGVSYSTVRRQLIAAGVPIRENGRGHTLLTPEHEDDLARMYRAGYTARNLAEMYHISIKRVEKILHRLGVRKNTRATHCTTQCAHNKDARISA